MSGREVLWRASKPLNEMRRGVKRRDPAKPVDFLSPGVFLERFRSGAERPVLLDRQRAQTIRSQNPEQVALLLRAADRAALGSFAFFGYPEVDLGQPIDWNYDPISNIHWPNIPSSRINHRVFRGDVKWIWELNRLQHLPWLAQAWLFTGDSRYERAAFAHLDSWIQQNPPGQGIAWRGAFEAGIRAISIAVALQGLRDSAELTVDRFERVVKVLAESADRCWKDRSLFSSANNHLVGEMAGLAVVAVMFPELASSAKWESSAVQTLSLAANEQILADGTSAEQSVGYQAFTVELLHLVAALLTERDGQAPREIIDAIERSSKFLAAVIGQHDLPPRYGDDDGGFALRLGAEPVRSVHDHLSIVSACGRPMAGGQPEEALAAQWFKAMPRSPSAGLLTRVAGGAADDFASFFARDGGLVVFRDERRRITMDVGPLGYLGIAAHGHADALAITLSIDGQEIVSDPGTGSYYGHPEWRRSMRSTRAHATVCIDGQDQSINAGPFMWLRHARTYVHKVDLAAGVVDAEHDGYTRLPGKPLHRRWLIAPPNHHSQLVIDMISGRGAHNLRTSWPLHPSVDVRPVDHGHLLSCDGSVIVKFLYASTAPLAVEQVRGDVANNLGWWSGRLESRTPTWWLSTHGDGELPIVIVTLISTMDGPTVDSLSVDLHDGTIAVQWSEEDEDRTVKLRITPR